MTLTPNMQEWISTMQAQAGVSTIPAAIAQAADTAEESEMQQMSPQSPQQQYSSSNYETCTESQWPDITIHQQHGVTSATTWLTDGKSSQVLASHLSQVAPMRPQDSLSQLATNYSTSTPQKSMKDGTISKAPATKVIRINGEDMTAAYDAGNKECARVWRRGREHFTIHKLYTR